MVGVRPEAKQLTNLVRAANNWLDWSGEGHPTASRRWLGRRPDGPGAEPLGKDLTPLRTVDSDTETEGGTGPGGREAEADWGCLVNISWRTVAEGVARPSEVRALMALLYWLS